MKRPVVQELIINILADFTLGTGYEVAMEIRSYASYSELVSYYCYRRLQDFWTPSMQTIIKSTISAVSMLSCLTVLKNR